MSMELTHSKSLNESVESMDSKTPFGQLMGLASHMSKELGIQGVLTSSDNYQVKLDLYINDIRAKISDVSYEFTDTYNLTNALMLKWILTQNSEIKHWYCRDNFIVDGGKIIYNDLWNGYRLFKYNDVSDGIIVELDTESAKFYKGIKGIWNPLQYEVSDQDYEKFWELVGIEDWDNFSPIEFLKSLMLNQGIIDNDNKDSIIIFGTKRARSFYDSKKWNKYGVDIISTEDETRFEYLSAVNAHEKAPQAGLQMYDLCATIGYNKYVYKGYNTLTFNQTLYHEIGIERLIEIVTDGRYLDKVKFKDEEDFDEYIEDIKDELYRYEDGLISKVKKVFYSMISNN